jgi:hypothetical protein
MRYNPKAIQWGELAAEIGQYRFSSTMACRQYTWAVYAEQYSSVCGDTYQAVQVKQYRVSSAAASGQYSLGSIA